LAIIGTAGGAAAVAGVDLFLGIHEEDHERQVVVEVEQIQVQVVDARQADPDELVGDVFDVLQTDNLPVKFMASRSRLAADDDHERLAAFARQGFAFFEAKNPAMLACLKAAAPGLSQQ